jgi:hypothetical protein
MRLSLAISFVKPAASPIDIRFPSFLMTSQVVSLLQAFANFSSS